VPYGTAGIAQRLTAYEMDVMQSLHQGTRACHDVISALYMLNLAILFVLLLFKLGKQWLHC